MRYYPAFLDIRDKRCLIVGAGNVGLRKLSLLLKADPLEVLVLDPHPPSDEYSDLMRHGAVVYENRSFHPDDLHGRTLVFAASGSHEENRKVADLCRKAFIWCNIADDPERCSFIVPAHFQTDELMITVSTSGLSPALAKSIREEIESDIGCKYGRLLKVMGRVRPLVLASGNATEMNTKLFRELVRSDLCNALNMDNMERTKDILHSILPKDLHNKIGEIVHGLD